MGNLLVDNIGSNLGLHRQYGFFEDFLEFVDGDLFSKVDADSGATAAIDADGEGGLVLLTTGATDNNEAYLFSTQELFKFAANRPLVCEARIQYAEANTDDANVFFGFMDAIGANALVDDGVGPKASYSGAVFYKADGESVWSVENSIGATQKTTQLTADNSLDGTAQSAGGAAYQTLAIEVTPHGGGSCDVSFWIDDVLVAKHKDQSYTSATQMMVGCGVKAGGANSEVLTVDYISAYQLR